MTQAKLSDYLKSAVLSYLFALFRCQWIYWSDELQLLPPANEVAGRICFYTCLSFCSQGGASSQHALLVTWPDGPFPGGVCLWVGGRQTPPPPPRSQIRSTGGRYASHWNAYLFRVFLKCLLSYDHIVYFCFLPYDQWEIIMTFHICQKDVHNKIIISCFVSRIVKEFME